MPEQYPKKIWVPEYVSLEMRTRARELRQRATPAEKMLWSALRNYRSGHKFRRQYPLHSYIMDFFCPLARLAIELDGDSHLGREAEDAYRQGALESQGIKVLRFRNEEVLYDLDRVLSVVIREIEARGDRQHTTAR